MLDNWDAAFPNCEPIAHLMREQFRPRWVRFHSLPESKRYPENDAEMGEVLRRHNTILGDLFAGERTVVLLTTGYSESAESAPRHPALGELDPTATPWRVVPLHRIEGSVDTNYWHISASLWEWRPGAFDPLVRLVAEDVIGDVNMVDPHCRWLLHPYDGGMDVILATSAERDRLKSAYPDWLSAHPDGL